MIVPLSESDFVLYQFESSFIQLLIAKYSPKQEDDSMSPSYTCYQFRCHGSLTNVVAVWSGLWRRMSRLAGSGLRWTFGVVCGVV